MLFEGSSYKRPWETWNYCSRGREITGCKSVENQDSLVLCSQNFSLCSCFSDSRAHLFLPQPNITSPHLVCSDLPKQENPQLMDDKIWATMHVIRLFPSNLWFRLLLKEKDTWPRCNAFSHWAQSIVVHLGLGILPCIASVPVGPHLLQKLETVFVWVTWEHKKREYKLVLFPRDCHSCLACYQPAGVNSKGTRTRYKRRISSRQK